MCRKEGCKKTKEPWCGDHTKYGIKEELEKDGKKVCSNLERRGCTETVETTNPNIKQCEKCRRTEREADKKRREKIKKSNENLCYKCGKIFESYKTKNNEDSTKCEHCMEAQRKIEDKRNRDNRDYAKEMENNPVRREKRRLYEEKRNKILKPYQEYRARRIQLIGLDEFHRINNENAVENRKKNIEKDKDYYKESNKNKSENIDYKYNIHINRCKRDGIECELTEEEIKEFFKEECFYCGELGNNGIDRIENDIGYNVDNCVSCCSMCNYMKACLDSITFIDRAKFILINQGKLISDEQIDYVIFRDVSYKPTYLSCKNKAKERNKSFSLSKEQFHDIIKNECYICGKPNDDKHQNGIDRVSNETGYTLENSKSCCGECNYMKKDYDLNDMLNKLYEIYNNCQSEKLPEVIKRQIFSINPTGRIKMTKEDKEENARIRKIENDKIMNEKNSPEKSAERRFQKKKDYDAFRALES
jgi:hypothetical protein